MSVFRLRWSAQSVDVISSVTIGRAEECQVMLDDPLVSRRHALVVFEDSKLWLEDLESRNGVVVNGVKANGRHRLVDGDVLGVGGQVIRVVATGAEGQFEDAGVIDAPVPTRRFEPLGVVGHLAEKALSLGHPEEAERLLAGVLEQILREGKAGLFPNQETLTTATGMAVRLLAATGRGVWLDWLVQLYSAMRKPWPAVVVDELYEKGRASVGHDRLGLRRYCELLRTEKMELGPAERFQVGRIEGLERVLSAL